MRKVIKIKTSVLLLAWSVIFLHGIIPHNHHDHRDTCCNHIMHHQSPLHASDTNIDRHNNFFDEVNKSAEKEKLICHFSTELIHSTDFDHFFTKKTGYFTPLRQTSGIQFIVTGPSEKINRPAYLLKPLRAPPSA